MPPPAGYRIGARPSSGGETARRAEAAPEQEFAFGLLALVKVRPTETDPSCFPDRARSSRSRAPVGGMNRLGFPGGHLYPSNLHPSPQPCHFRNFVHWLPSVILFRGLRRALHCLGFSPCFGGTRGSAVIGCRVGASAAGRGTSRGRPAIGGSNARRRWRVSSPGTPYSSQASRSHFACFPSSSSVCNRLVTTILHHMGSCGVRLRPGTVVSGCRMRKPAPVPRCPRLLGTGSPPCHPPQPFCKPRRLRLASIGAVGKLPVEPLAAASPLSLDGPHALGAGASDPASRSWQSFRPSVLGLPATTSIRCTTRAALPLPRPSPMRS